MQKQTIDLKYDATVTIEFHQIRTTNAVVFEITKGDLKRKFGATTETKRGLVMVEILKQARLQNPDLALYPHVERRKPHVVNLIQTPLIFN